MSSVTGKALDLALLKRTFTFTRPYKKTVAITAVLIIFVALLSPLRPYLIQLAIDKYVMVGDMKGLRTMVLILISVLITEAVLQFYQTYLANWLGQTVIKDMRLKVYSKIMGFKTQYFDTNPIGKLVTRVVSDIETISEVFSQGLLIIFGDILKLLLVLIFMFGTDWRLSLYCLLPVPVLIIATNIFKKAIKSAFQEVRNQVSNLNSFVQEHVSGMSIVQLFNREQIEYEKFQDLNKKHRNAHIRTVWAYSIFFPVVEILSALSLAALVWWGADGVLQGKVSQGSLVAFILYIYMLYRPIRELADRFNTLQLGMVSAERVFKVLDTDAYIADNGTHIATSLKGSISIKNLWFSYNKEEFVLKDVSLEIEPGQTLALVGATGSGKSSIINVLGRYYEFQKGEILVDGRDIREYSIPELRARIALVQQDVLLFSDSILNNITLNDLGISFQKVVEASKAVGAHEFIMELPGDYNYNVRERGSMLSLGQRQLISFIRAYVSDPDILILDEATSSIDAVTEELIKRSTEVLTKDRTSIIVAHRLSTIQKAQRIAVIHQGEVKEIGNHQELIKKNGFYKKYFQIQFTHEAQLDL
ncbi:MAG: ABC transporter ATP-binding protein [Vicingaceae bacterium]